jgi:hypothetical protein
MSNKATIDGNGNIIIQGVEGATITINPNNTQEIRQLIMDFGSKLSDLPADILKMIEQKQDLNSEIKNGANLYLTVLTELYEFGTGNRLKFSLTITNLTKGNRYFNQPFFKVYPMFEVKTGIEHDTFVMFPEQGNVFAKKLEYGEPFSVSYEIKEGAYKMYEQIMTKDKEGAYIQAFSTTTVGELYESNKFSIKTLFENLKWIKK